MGIFYLVVAVAWGVIACLNIALGVNFKRVGSDRYKSFLWFGVGYIVIGIMHLGLGVIYLASDM